MSDPTGQVTEPLSGTIGVYAKNAGVYKCPADQSVYLSGGKLFPRVRSCSANCYMGTTLSEQRNGGEINGDYMVFNKFSNLSGRLGPAEAIVYTDENPVTINDGFLLISVPDPSQTTDRPATNHGKNSSLSFADGHVQLHQWQNEMLVPAKPGTSDFPWLVQHISVPITP